MWPLSAATTWMNPVVVWRQERTYEQVFKILSTPKHSEFLKTQLIDAAISVWQTCEDLPRKGPTVKVIPPPVLRYVTSQYHSPWVSVLGLSGDLPRTTSAPSRGSCSSSRIRISLQPDGTWPLCLCSGEDMG